MKNLDLSNFDDLLWDLDGTLTASAPGIINCVKYALDFFGINETEEAKLNLFIGPPLTESFMNIYGFSKEKALQALLKYQERYTEKGMYENSLFDGVKETLAALKAKGKHLIVATAKPEMYMTPILKNYGIADYFEFAGGADLKSGRDSKSQVIEYVIKKCSLEEARANGKVLMIGDRSNDIEGAHKNNLPCCACLWGYGSMEEFEKYKADFVIKTPSDLLN